MNQSVFKIGEDVYIYLPQKNETKKVGFVKNSTYYTSRSKKSVHIFHRDNSIRLAKEVIDSAKDLGFDNVKVVTSGKPILKTVDEIKSLSVDKIADYEEQYVLPL